WPQTRTICGARQMDGGEAVDVSNLKPAGHIRDHFAMPKAPCCSRGDKKQPDFAEIRYPDR
ncbi:MAG: hypothetical protein DMF96_31525, partial [Acidobacteria bacterium]